MKKEGRREGKEGEREGRNKGGHNAELILLFDSTDKRIFQPPLVFRWKPYHGALFSSIKIPLWEVIMNERKGEKSSSRLLKLVQGKIITLYHG